MTYQPKDFIVWSEIPVTDLEAGMAFYSKVTGAALAASTDMGPQPIAVFPTQEPRTGVAGHLYVGKPARDGEGPTVHLSAEGPLEEVVDRIWDAGGKVVSEIIAIPAGRFVYCKDPFGNSIGFFEGA
ncbi:MAG: VOC family protein [Rhodobacteraceae bacterium]|nr:VOC family protein [Paracoccaceae bacterium]